VTAFATGSASGETTITGGTVGELLGLGGIADFEPLALGGIADWDGGIADFELLGLGGIADFELLGLGGIRDAVVLELGVGAALLELVPEAVPDTLPVPDPVAVPEPLFVGDVEPVDVWVEVTDGVMDLLG